MAAIAAVLVPPSVSSSSSRRRTVFSSRSSPLPWKPFLRNRHSSKESSNEEVGAGSQKRFLGRGKDEAAAAAAPSAASPDAFKSFGMPEKEKGLVYDLKEQQVNDTGNLQGATFLNAVVKVYCTHTAPDYSLPWQKQRQFTSTGSAFMIGEGKLLTNAHCVEHGTQVKVKRRGDDTKFVAKVLARGVECDIALLSVESEEFWRGAEPLRFGRLPCLQDSVTVVGYPLGGDTISVTKGVVSRIEAKCDAVRRKFPDPIVDMFGVANPAAAPWTLIQSSLHARRLLCDKNCSVRCSRIALQSSCEAVKMRCCPNELIIA